MIQVCWIDRKVQSFTPHYSPRTYESKEETPLIRFYYCLKTA